MGGSSTWVTLLGNIILYSSCGMGGPNFENPNFSKSRYENFDEIASKYIYIYTLFALFYMIKSGSLQEQKQSHV